MNIPSFKSSNNFDLSYIKIEGNEPYLFYVHGNKSSKNSFKSAFIQKIAEENGLGFFSFDMTGHGDAQGDYIKNGSISLWKQDLIDAIDFLNKKVVLIASSMGGWLTSLVAHQLEKKIYAILGLSVAPDFIVDIQKACTDFPQFVTEDDEKILLRLPDGFLLAFSREFICDALNNLVLEKRIEYNKKVVLIHGDSDNLVHFSKAVDLKDSLISDDVKLILLKNADHSLQDEYSLTTIKQELLKLV